MSIFTGIILGFIQGLTEFLPISSSGHLILARQLLFLDIGSTEEDLAIDAILQLGTILAVGIYFFNDIKEVIANLFKLVLRRIITPEKKNLTLALVVGTVPAIIFGILLESHMETVFRNSKLVALSLILGAGLMYIAEKISKKNKTLTPKKGFIVGLFQALALVPGISRSGATISGGLIVGLNRVEATRFSFLLAFPIITGTGLKKLFDAWGGEAVNILDISLAFGFVTSFLVGLAAIHFLITYLKNHDLKVFIIYRIILAAVVLVFF